MSRDPQINIRLPPELKEDFKELCEHRNTSINSELVRIIKKEVDDHKLDREKLKLRQMEKEQLLKEVLEAMEKAKNDKEKEIQEEHYDALFEELVKRSTLKK